MFCFYFANEVEQMSNIIGLVSRKVPVWPAH